MYSKMAGFRLSEDGQARAGTAREASNMSREYPDWVNPWKAAEGNRRFAGTIPLRNMSRLKPLLADDQGEARFEAQFTRDALGWATIQLDVRAELPLVCQASLERYDEPVSRSSLLAVAKDPEQQDELPEHYEATLAEDGRLVFLDLVQDELILAVPQVPRKPGLEEVRFSTDPDGVQAGEDEEQKRPFAALGDLLKGGRE